MKFLEPWILKHKAAGPATAAGEAELFFDATGVLSKQSQGVVTVVEGGGGGAAVTAALPYFKGSATTTVTQTGGANASFDTRVDPQAGWSTSTNDFTITTPGTYRIYAQSRRNTTSAVAPYPMIYKNGVLAAMAPAAAAIASSGASVMDHLVLASGDKIAVRYSANNAQMAESADTNLLIIEYVPQVINTAAVNPIQQNITAFGSTVIPYGGWQTPQIIATGKRIDLRGLCQLTSSGGYGNQFAIVNIPAPYRPISNSVQFGMGGIGASNIMVRLDCYTDGNVYFTTGFGGAGYISLEGLHWWTN